jgi:hypothetical protein
MPCNKCTTTDETTRLKAQERLKLLPLLAERPRPKALSWGGAETLSTARAWKGVSISAETRRRLWSIGRVVR